MGLAMRTMGAAKFKAQCLAVMDEVQRRGEPVLVTKNGKPVAKLVPLDEPTKEEVFAHFRIPARVQYSGDVVSPASDPDDWNALR